MDDMIEEVAAMVAFLTVTGTGMASAWENYRQVTSMLEYLVYNV
ncbi:hypothetical protein [Xanthomonas sp. GPE 39]|nr:hypothetical protein [Xanthomonas sp. GPE 39]